MGFLGRFKLRASGAQITTSTQITSAETNTELISNSGEVYKKNSKGAWDKGSFSGSFVGSIIALAGSNVPTGYLECNGATLSRTIYSDLFTSIGTTYGAGDGSTTFKIPDLRGEFIRGFDNGRGIDTGRVLGSSQIDTYKSHTHTGTTLSAGAHTHTYAAPGITNDFDGGSGNAAEYAYTATTSSSGAHTHTLTIDESGFNETRPRNIAMKYCIKY